MIDCGAVERAVLDGSDLTGADVAAHVAGCETCRFLVDGGAPVARALAGSSPPAPAADLGALRAAVAADLAGERGLLGALRGLPRPARLALAAAVMTPAILFFSVFVRRPDWDTYPPLRMALTIGALAALALGLTWITLRPLWLPPLPASAVRGLALAAVLVPVGLALLPEASPFQPPGFSCVASAYLCFAIGAGMALLCLLAACALDRGGHRSGPTALLAALGAGMIGVIAGQIFCPVNHALHLVTGHATIPVGLALGYLVSRRL